MYLDEGWIDTFPHTSISTGIVAEDNGVIVGFVILQPVIRMEPVCVAPSHRGRVYLPRLLKEAERLLPTGVTYYCGDAGAGPILAKRMGATMITATGTAYMKEVR
jgi:hypothetical protein